MNDMYKKFLSRLSQKARVIPRFPDPTAQLPLSTASTAPRRPANLLSR